MKMTTEKIKNIAIVAFLDNGKAHQILTKKDNKKSLRDELKSLIIDKKFEKAEKDLIATHNVKKIKYGKFKIEV